VAVASGKLEILLDITSGQSNLGVLIRTPEFIVLSAISVVMAITLPLFSPIAGSLLTFFCMMPVYYMGFQVHATRPLIPMEFSLITILVLYVIHVLISYFKETAKKQKVIQVLGQYMPPELARQLGGDPDALKLEGEARELSIMFCDVRSFTSISESLEPRQLTQMLNTLFNPLTEIVYRHHGTIDKYMGDALMAFWGAPIKDSHHAGNAVAAAFEIQEALVNINREFESQGWPKIQLGIGINTGVVSVGNMGSRYRMAYTVVGDAVNLAARLQDLTRVYQCRVIVGENTRKSFPAASYRELGLVQVKGKQELTRIFEPCNPTLDPASTLVSNMQMHNSALQKYYARKWQASAELFKALQKLTPDDPLYAYYLERISEFESRPPTEGWQGEIRYSVS
jgi:adenylate cyclase